MKYVGSKARIAKYILEIIEDLRGKGQPYIEPFCGGANMLQFVEGDRRGSDVNDCLVSCLSALSSGWEPPKEITRELYNKCREKYNSGMYSRREKRLIGYVGINGSYGGRYYDGGYAGITQTKCGKERNYPLEAYNNVMKQVPYIKGCKFSSGSYELYGLTSEDERYSEDFKLTSSSIIYCDPPYTNTKEYIEAKKSGFDSDQFWEWCRKMVKEGHSVIISEYVAPDDFICIWEKGVTSSLRSNGVIKEAKISTEKVFIHKSQLKEYKDVQRKA